MPEIDEQLLHAERRDRGRPSWGQEPRISADFDTDAGVKKFCEDLAARSAFILRACVSLFYFRLPNSPKLKAV